MTGPAAFPWTAETAPWRTWGSGVVCAATIEGENAGVLGVFDSACPAETACADHNAALDLAWLLDTGWLARLGQCRAPDNSPAGYYAEVRRMGAIVSVNFTGATVGEAAARAREWAEGEGAS